MALLDARYVSTRALEACRSKIAVPNEDSTEGDALLRDSEGDLKAPNGSATGDALALHVQTRGSGRPLVLLHGFGASSFTWRHWVPDLSRYSQVLLVDLKGCGLAPKPRDGRYSPGDMASDVCRLIVQRDLRDVTLVGHSMGGGIALMVALQLQREAERRVAGLVSVSGVAYRQALPPHIGMVRRHAWARSLFQVVPATWLMRRVLSSIVYDPAVLSGEMLDGYAQPLRSRGARLALTATALQLLPRDLDELVACYPSLDVSALLIWGRQDPVVPLKLAHRLAKDLPGSRLEVLDSCGHIPQEEKPRESLQLLRAFLTAT